MFRKIGVFCLMVTIVLGLLSFQASRVSAACGTANIALNKTATASSIQGAGYAANLAVDGSTTTRWGSAFSDPQWLQVDLGSTQTICQVTLIWEAAYGKSYTIQTSPDAVTWTTIYTTTTGAGGTDDLTGLAGSGRYIRMNGTVRATQWGYSIWEFAVYAGTTTATNTPTTAPTLTRTNTPTTPTNTPVQPPTNTPIPSPTTAAGCGT